VADVPVDRHQRGLRPGEHEHLAGGAVACDRKRPGGDLLGAHKEEANDGWASPVKPRPIYLVLDTPGQATKFVSALTGVDIRSWASGPISVTGEFTARDLPPGSGYRLSLWLPDAASSLQDDPDYAIKLANVGIWDGTTGYNALSTNVVVQAP
jgi:hypothetical protein